MIFAPWVLGEEAYVCGKFQPIWKWSFGGFFPSGSKWCAQNKFSLYFEQLNTCANKH
jgi:hypothetical protein